MPPFHPWRLPKICQKSPWRSYVRLYRLKNKRGWWGMKYPWKGNYKPCIKERRIRRRSLWRKVSTNEIQMLVAAKERKAKNFVLESIATLRVILLSNVGEDLMWSACRKCNELGHHEKFCKRNFHQKDDAQVVSKQEEEQLFVASYSSSKTDSSAESWRIKNLSKSWKDRENQRSELAMVITLRSREKEWLPSKVVQV